MYSKMTVSIIPNYES